MKDPYDKERYEQLLELAAEMAAPGAQLPPGQVLEIFRLEAGYATPKIGVRAFVLDKAGRVLLAKESQDGLWSLPGGWADVGDSAGETAVKEVREETGYEVRAVRLLACYHQAKHPHPPFYWDIYNLCIQCELTGGDARDSSETSGARFFALDELPPLSLPRVTPMQIQRMYELVSNPALPTDFD